MISKQDAVVMVMGHFDWFFMLSVVWHIFGQFKDPELTKTFEMILFLIPFN